MALIFFSHMVYWLVVWTPLKNMNVNWDDEIPNIWENKKRQPNHQPVYNWDHIDTEELMKHSGV